MGAATALTRSLACLRTQHTRSRRRLTEEEGLLRACVLAACGCSQALVCGVNRVAQKACADLEAVHDRETAARQLLRDSSISKMLLW
jgi:hypothetical protein